MTVYAFILKRMGRQFTYFGVFGVQRAVRLYKRSHFSLDTNLDTNLFAVFWCPDILTPYKTLTPRLIAGNTGPASQHWKTQ